MQRKKHFGGERYNETHLRSEIHKCFVCNYLIVCDCAFHLRLKAVTSDKGPVTSKPNPCKNYRLEIGMC